MQNDFQLKRGQLETLPSVKSYCLCPINNTSLFRIEQMCTSQKKQKLYYSNFLFNLAAAHKASMSNI